MNTKAPIPMKPTDVPKSSGSSPSAEFAAQWSEARLAYPLYVALAEQFNLAPLPHPQGEMPPLRPTREVFDADLKWLETIDEKVRAFQLRQLPPEILNASEESLRAFAHRQLKKQDKNNFDRDKIDLLLVQYFAMCAPEELYRGEICLEDVARVLAPVLPQADPTPLDWCEPLENILGTLKDCQSLRDLMEHGLLEQGRLLKDSAGAMFYDPAALVAFTRFNFLLRRAFIRMLHADLSAVKQAVEELDGEGVKNVDCRRAGFSAAETTAQIRYYAENWRQPFHKDYTATSVSRAFEQLLALRTDLEEALARIRPQVETPLEIPAALISAGGNGNARPAGEDATKEIVSGAAAQKDLPSVATPAMSPEHPAKTSDAKSKSDSRSPEKKISKAPAGLASPTAPAEMEKCLEAIWEQLIAAPPSRGRSMSTVVLQDTKVLLSSWEVAAFVSEGDQEAEDLRRAVVARALLALGMDLRKRSGDLGELASAVTLAKTEVSYFQGRVEAAKRAKNTEAAVNLGISTKRLLSFIEEAEKLQP